VTTKSLGRRAATAAIAVITIVAVTAGAALLVRTLWRTATSGTQATECVADSYYLDPDQAAVASTMVGVVLTRALPERAAVLVLAAGLQESKLENLPLGEGDRDSVGVLQQRPSQGWGSASQISDIHYATGKFLDALVKLPDWQTEPLADAIQDVQISADASAYAPHEPEAQALADALTGVRLAGLSCSFPAPSVVATPAQVASAVTADLPVNQPTLDSNGLSVSVPGASWATAAWFVANADRLGLDSVSYAQRAWSRTKGWRDDTTAASDAVVATLHH
jgi:hypothetical protein